MTYEEFKKQVHDRVLQEIDFSREILDEDVLRLIDGEITGAGRTRHISVREMKQLRQELFHSIRRLDVLQDLVDDPSVTEIMINGPEHIFIERDGILRDSGVRFATQERLEDVVQAIVAGCNRTVNAASPIADARLPNGSRVNVVMQPAALGGPFVTIRRFPEHPIGIRELVAFGSVSEEIAAFLQKAVASGCNIFVSGGTGSGKTTFLNALSEFVPEDERVITIEDNAELQIRHVKNLVRMEAREGGFDGLRPITIRDLIRTSLRMRPDRIIVGEVRGGEAIDMLQAMNTGHVSMSTGHANSAADMLSRLETMALMGMELPVQAIRGQIASAIDILIHLGRLRDHSRRVLEIAEICGLTDGEYELSPLFRFREKGEKDGRIIGTFERENSLRNTQKLEHAGLLPREARG